MKKILLIIALAFSLISNAQNWQGTFQTKFGTLKLVEENGMIYGDYANNGTILAYEVIDRYKTTLNGIYFNGNERGKFQLIRNSYSGNYEDKFIGYYGASDNSTCIADIKANSKNWTFTIEPNWQWTGTKQPSGQPNDLQTAVWNGKWNTTFGEINLEQIGKKVKGKYSNLGDIDADFDKVTKKLKGTFTNKGKKGYFEFSFEGNSFKGKWGWNTSMAEGIWDGTKVVKTNKIIATSTTSTNALTTQSNTATTKYTVSAVSILTGESNIYGFWGFKLFKVTQDGRVQVPNFGNKSSDVYNETENSSKIIKSSSYNFPNSPEFFREFIIPNTDINNPNIKYELEVYVHAKNKVLGTNTNYGYQKQIYRLDNIQFNKNIRISLSQQNSSLIGGYIGFFEFKIVKQ
ncbi:hypothetical protein [Flavobacterium channae]|uniref:hypothetical protein n=1 Tax=Flavobacterium channae TaxID=2897181 RepID=UPI001E52C6BE|nr:hypothetical protein [Flavobacterium channae]UGS22896.1 hypothetical protein LOS89_08935 [Flavobacterium channae]